MLSHPGSVTTRPSSTFKYDPKNGQIQDNLELRLP